MCSDKEIEIDSEKMKEGVFNIEQGLESLDKAMGLCDENEKQE